MPYKRRYYQKRKRKTPMFGRADKYVANKALKLAKYAISNLNVEKKLTDTSASTVSVANSFGYVCLNSLLQGDTDSTRNGDQVKFKSILTRIKVAIHASATHSLCRFMLVIDHQPNGAAPTSTQLFEVSSNLISPINKDHSHRFQVIYSKFTSLDLNSSTSETFIEKFIKLDLKTLYKSNNGNVSDITTNSIYFVYASDEPIYPPEMNYYFRLRYIDN